MSQEVEEPGDSILRLKEQDTSRVGDVDCNWKPVSHAIWALEVLLSPDGPS